MSGGREAGEREQEGRERDRREQESKDWQRKAAERIEQESRDWERRVMKRREQERQELVRSTRENRGQKRRGMGFWAVGRIEEQSSALLGALIPREREERETENRERGYNGPTGGASPTSPGAVAVPPPLPHSKSKSGGGTPPLRHTVASPTLPLLGEWRRHCGCP